MELKEINSLVELFFKKFEEKTSNDFKKMKEIFLISLKQKNEEKKFISGPLSYSWVMINNRIKILSNYLREIISKGDRCILLSENRPEWLISDIAIMNAGGVTVPLFTTYSENDYAYIINDCAPKVCIVSNDIQLKNLDLIRVFSKSEMIPKTVVSITGHVKKPGQYRLINKMTLYDLLFLAGGFNDPDIMAKSSSSDDDSDPMSYFQKLAES